MNRWSLCPLGRAVLAVLLLAGGGSAAHAATVALVTDVVGDVRHGSEPVKLLAELDAGHELALAAEAMLVVFYVADGSEWTMKGPGRYRLAPKGPEANAGASAASRRAAPPAYKDMRLRPERVRQAAVIMRGHDLRLVSPANGDVVLDADVSLAWELQDSRDTEFEVEMIDASGRQLFKTTTRAFELAVPQTVRLVPGQRYTWAVLARAPGMTRTYYRASEFRIADAATRRRVETARPAGNAPFSERVLFVALLEQVGAHAAADEQRRVLSAQRPAAWTSDR